MMTRRLLLATALATLITAAAGTAAAAAGPSRGPAATSAFWTDVAHHLGVSPNALQKALRAASLDRVAELRQAGRISPGEAKALAARIQAGEMHFNVMPWHGGHGASHHGMRMHSAIFGEVAGYLGLSPEALRSQLQQGRTLRQITMAQGKSVQGLQALMTANLKSRLDARVKSGEMTTAEQQKILSRFTRRLPQMLDHSFKAKSGSHAETTKGS